MYKDKRRCSKVTCAVCNKRFNYYGNTLYMWLYSSIVHPNDFALMEKKKFKPV